MTSDFRIHRLPDPVLQAAEREEWERRFRDETHKRVEVDVRTHCSVCRHPRTEHTPPAEGRPYWRCTHWVGHPFDGYCECSERHFIGEPE